MHLGSHVKGRAHSQPARFSVAYTMCIAGLTDRTDEVFAPFNPKVLVIGDHDLTGKGRLGVRDFDEVRAVLVSDGHPPLIWTHYPLADVPPGHVNIHGYLHVTPPSRSRHIDVSVEQLDYEPISLARLRRLAQGLARGEFPPGATTLERIRYIEDASGSTGD